MKKYLLLPITLTAGIFLFVAIIGFTGIESILNAFRSFTLGYLAIFIAVSAVSYLLSTYRWQLILKEQGEKMPFRKLLDYKNASFSVSYVTPFARMGGEPIRAYFLRKHKIKTAKAFSSVFLDKSLETIIDATVAGIIILVLLMTFPIPYSTREALAVALLLISGSIIFFYVSSKKGFFTTLIGILPKKGFLKKISAKLIEMDNASGHFLRNKKSTVAKIILIGLAQWVLTIIQFKYAALLIGFDASFTQLLIIIVSVGISTLIPVPAGLGVLEASTYSIFTLLGSEGGAGIALSLLIRFKDLLIVLLGFVHLSHESMGLLGKFYRKDVEIIESIEMKK